MKVFLLLCFGFFLCVGSTQDSTLNFQDSITKDSTFAASLQSQDSNQTFPFKTGKSPLDGVNGFQYFGVILVLVGLLAFLWYVKNRINTPQVTKNPLQKFFDKGKNAESVQICSVTTFSAQSKLIIFEAYGKRYLVAINQGQTTLLDSYFVDSKVFKEMLEQDTRNAE